MFKQDLQLHKGSLNIEKIHNSWYEKYKNLNYGAFITFVGIVRDENEIQGLSFDIYEPILKKWFSSWQEKAKTSKFYQNAIYTWTCLDVKKRETAKNNNLNFFEFYTILELINWLNK